jgi:16S rRNA C1402 (ribose-2'-O) methylase RsmI
MLTYQGKGITQDQSTFSREPPLLEDLYKVLIGMESAEGKELADRLEKFVRGSASGIFNQFSNFDIKNHFTVLEFAIWRRICVRLRCISC